MVELEFASYSFMFLFGIPLAFFLLVQIVSR